MHDFGTVGVVQRAKRPPKGRHRLAVHPGSLPCTCKVHLHLERFHVYLECRAARGNRARVFLLRNRVILRVAEMPFENLLRRPFLEHLLLVIFYAQNPLRQHAEAHLSFHHRLLPAYRCRAHSKPFHDTFLALYVNFQNFSLYYIKNESNLNTKMEIFKIHHKGRRVSTVKAGLSARPPSPGIHWASPRTFL